MNDRIEFYKAGTNELVATIESPMVPGPGSQINIKKETWTVAKVAYALDYADDPIASCMRANVDLLEAKP